MLHAIIMAGGTGTRFWPASRNDAPKQLLRLVGDATMLRQTVDRLGRSGAERTPAGRHERAAGRGHARAVARAAGGGDRRRAVQARHGALHRPGRAARQPQRSRRHDGRDAGRPCHSPGREVSSRDSPGGGDWSMQSPGRIVTFGIKPTYPAEIFGYIHRGAADSAVGSQSWHAAPLYDVQRFQEKPDAATAKKYVDSGEYYWNTGIFVWRASTILDALRAAATRNARPPGKNRRRLGHARARRRVRARVRGHQADLDRLRRHGARHRRRRDRSAVRLGRPGRLAVARPAGRHRRKRQHDRRPAPGPGHDAARSSAPTTTTWSSRSA